jgi:zinc transport system substrate-binding protein
MRARIVLIAFAVAVVAPLPACGGGESDSQREVVAAFYPLAFAAERIAGQTAHVTNLTPAGAEPHDVELTARDVERIRSADVVLFLGSGFQPALEDAVADADGEVVDLLEGVELVAGSDEHGHEEERTGAGEDGDEPLDPHVWLDPVRFAAIVERVGEILDRSDQGAELASAVRSLDGEYRAGLRDCARREIVTSHGAFGYLARRYGLEQVAITGLSPEAEPTPGELERVVEEVREHGATTVFFETLVSPRLAETVAREVDADVAVLNPLEGLTDEELDRGEDYLSIMRANLAALRRALECR